jgi:hypothetical protein
MLLLIYPIVGEMEKKSYNIDILASVETFFTRKVFW